MRARQVSRSTTKRTLIMKDSEANSVNIEAAAAQAEHDRIQRLVDTNGRCWELLHQAGEHEAADKHFLAPGACGGV
jgi:hypothetical protein